MKEQGCIMSGQKRTINDDTDGTSISLQYNSCILQLHLFKMKSNIIINSGILYATCLQISIPRVEINF